MPATYAHHRFGNQLLANLPADAQTLVNRFRGLYDVGQHGPDMFFFYNPLAKTQIGNLGSDVHRQTGRAFFTKVCASLGPHPKEESLAYLYGVLAHYCLDSFCHPIVHRYSDHGPYLHGEIEAEFDRFLLETDGISSPHTHPLHRHIKLKNAHCRVVSVFYPPAKGRHIRQALRHMSLVNASLSAPAALRPAVGKILSLGGKEQKALLMHTRPNLRCSHLNEILLASYRQALQAYPSYLKQLQAHLLHRTPLGEDFAPDFG